jgi:hypothetical protein
LRLDARAVVFLQGKNNLESYICSGVTTFAPTPLSLPALAALAALAALTQLHSVLLDQTRRNKYNRYFNRFHEISNE